MRFGTINLLGLSMLSQVQAVADGILEWNGGCKACYDEGKSVCLQGRTADTSKFNLGYCCPFSTATQSDTSCKFEASRAFYCSAKTTPLLGFNKYAITNPSLLEFTCPSNDAKCPTDNKLEVSDDTVVSKNVVWNEALPNAAYNWNCKYKASIAKAYQDSIPADSGATPPKGFLAVGVAANGFGGTINIIGQENGKWIDYIEGTTPTTTNVRVYNDAKFAQKFFFPINWDIFVTFEPTKNYDDKATQSTAGRFDITASYQKELVMADYLQDQPKYVTYKDGMLIIDCAKTLFKDYDKCIALRTKTCVQDVNQEKCDCVAYPLNTLCKQVGPTPKTCEEDDTQFICKKTCDQDPTQDFCVFTCDEKPTQVKCTCANYPNLDKCLCPLVKGVRGIKDFDGNCVNTQEPWHSKVLFTIDGTEITTGTLTVTGIVLIVVGVLVFAIMSFIAWRKREAIKKGARRASDYVRRASQKLRASISGNRPADGQADKDAPVNNVNKDMLEMQQKAEDGDLSAKKLQNDGVEQLDAAPAQEDHQFGEEKPAGEVAIDGKAEVANDIYNN